MKFYSSRICYFTFGLATNTYKDVDQESKPGAIIHRTTHPYDVLLPYVRIDGLLGDFETYDQYRGYEYFIPGYESKEARHLPCERDKIDR
jgi:hypothetical protein